jgi:hypothetical protein
MKVEVAARQDYKTAVFFVAYPLKPQRGGAAEQINPVTSNSERHEGRFRPSK